jgi:hypothetical protein
MAAMAAVPTHDRQPRAAGFAPLPASLRPEVCRPVFPIIAAGSHFNFLSFH